MGIHDRDYYRDDPRGWHVGGLRAVPALIAVTVGAFVVQIFSAPGRGLPDPLLLGGAFHFASILDGEVWRIVTSFFVHPHSLFGIILGMLALYWFGTDVEEVYGTRRFFWLYLLAGVFVSGGKMLLGTLGVDPDKATAGAGGPLFAVLTLYALHFPTRQILLMFVIPVPVGVLVLLLIGVYVLLFVSGGGSRMDIAVPLLGAAFGMAYFKLAEVGYGVRRDDARAERRAERARPKLTLRPSDPPDDEDDFDSAPAPVPARPRAGKPDEYLEAKLDAVLEKMAKSGRESLTAEENAVLLRASEVYRQKGKT